MTRSLSGRLVLGIVALVAVLTIASGAATYVVLQHFLLDRVDSDLSGGRIAAIGELGGRQEAAENGQFPIGTVLELYRPDGTEIGRPLRYDFRDSTSRALPVPPRSLPSATENHPALVTLDGTAGVAHYRAAIWPEDSLGGNYVLLAIPMDDVYATLNQLLLVEGLVGLAVLVASAVIAFAITRIGLRPLDRMRAVAQEIAAGDLSRRVDPATSDTEIGRLGLALNGMLAQIESAFAERTASEGRLRRFIADASHELRTPLTSVRGYAEMLRRGAEKSPEDSAVARRRIEEEAVRMSEMVDDMLVLARLGQGRPLEKKDVDLQAIARDAVTDARVVSPKREITLDAPDHLLVSGDDTRLRQAIGNLLRNAVVHTPPETPIEVRLATANGTAHVTVADHGRGLPADERSRVFEPFYRADPSRSRDSGGAGLGLSIVAAVAGAHGGTVNVSDTPGGGATFDLALPAKSAQA